MTSMTDPSQAPLPPPAASAKLLGSSAFSAGSFSQALQHYDAALEIAPDAAVLYSNRSVTYLKLERLEDALKDALRASELAPAWARAWQRVGQAEEVIDPPPLFGDPLSLTMQMRRRPATLSLHCRHSKRRYLSWRTNLRTRLPIPSPFKGSANGWVLG